MIIEAVLGVLSASFVGLIWYIKDSINYKRYYERGMELMQIKAKAEALVEFERAFELNPVHVDTLIQLSYLYTENGSLSNAIDMYERLLKLNNPQNNHNKLSIAKREKEIYLKQKRFDLAYLENKKILYFESFNLDIKFEIARFFAGQGELDKAISSFREILEADSQHLQTNFYIGLCFATKEWINEAVKYLERTLNINKDYVMAAYVLGFIYKDKMRVDSIEYFERVIERAKNKELKYSAVRACGLTCIELNFLDKAVKLFRNYLSEEVPPAWVKEFGYNLGWAYMLSGNADAAVDEWARIANQDPGFMNVAQLIQEGGTVDFQDLENEWRIYSANVTYPLIQEYINMPRKYDIKALDEQHENWLIKVEQDQKMFSSVGIKNPETLGKSSIIRFRGVCRTIVKSFNYKITKEINNSDGIDIVAIHNDDETRVVFMRFRNWMHPVDETIVQNTKRNVDEFGCKIGYLITCGSFKLPARDMAARTKIKLIDSNQLRIILRKI